MRRFRRVLAALAVVAGGVAVVATATVSPVSALPTAGRIYHFLPWPEVLYDSVNPFSGQPDLAAGTSTPLPDATIVALSFTAHGDGLVVMHDCNAAPDASSDPIIASLISDQVTSYTAVEPAGANRCFDVSSPVELLMTKLADIADPRTFPLDRDFVPMTPQVLFDGDLPANSPVGVDWTPPEASAWAVLRVTILATAGPGKLGIGEVSGFTTPLQGGPDSLLAYVRVPCICVLDFHGSFALQSFGAASHVMVTLEGLFSAGSPPAPVEPPTDRLMEVPPIRFTPASPHRVLDTRFGLGARAGRLEPGQVLPLDLHGDAGAAGVSAVLNLTAVDGAADGFLTAYPCDEPTPDVSNVNFRVGQTRANLATVALSAQGTVCITSSASVHVLVDFAGSYSDDGSAIDSYRPDDPHRVVDTRLAVGAPAGKLTGVLTLPVARSGEAVTLNVTAVDPDSAGFVSLFPCGGSVPDVSNVNFSAHSVTANLATVSFGGSLSLCATSSTPVHLLVDVEGYFVPLGTSGFEPITPARVFDTRFPPSGEPHLQLIPDDVLVLDFSGSTNPPAGAIVNVTATAPVADGFLTVFPCDAADIPDVSNVNFTAHSSVANLVHSKVASDGTLCIVTSATTDVIVDLSGFTTVNGWTFAAVPLT